VRSYQLFYEGSHTFLLSARQVKKAAGAAYVISCTTEAGETGSTDLMGKVRSNFLGTEFTISDGGRKPGKKEEPVVGDAGEHTSLGPIPARLGPHSSGMPDASHQQLGLPCALPN
jgi:hypothetical protein